MHDFVMEDTVSRGTEREGQTYLQGDLCNLELSKYSFNSNTPPLRARISVTTVFDPLVSNVSSARSWRKQQ